MTSKAERICPSCRGASPADARFCRACGIILPRTKTASPSDSPARGLDRLSELGSRYPVLPQLAVLAVVVVVGGMVYRHQRRSALIPVAGVPEAASDAQPSPAAKSDAPAKPSAGSGAPAVAARPDSGRAAETNARAERSRPEEARSAERGEYRGAWYRVRNRAPLRDAPSEDAEVVTMLKAGTKVWVTRVLPGFLAVQSVTGKPPGYISRDDVVEISDG